MRPFAAVAIVWLVAVSAPPDGARGTLVKAGRIAIAARAEGTVPQGTVSRGFTLASVPSSTRLSDAGAAVLPVDRVSLDVRDERRVRRLEGAELFEGRRGTLALRWSGRQHGSHAGWGRISGTWCVLAGTGAYASSRGRGSFTSDASLAATDYRGLLVTTV